MYDYKFLEIMWVWVFMLFVVGIYGLIAKRNIIKIIMSLMIIRFAFNIFFIFPVREFDKELLQNIILTTMTIELVILAVLVSIGIRIYQKYGTFDLSKINKLKG